MTPSKRVKQWSLGLIIVFALVAVAFVWLRSDPPNFSAFVLDSSLASVGAESSALDSRANPALEPSYFTIPNKTPSAHASSIVALEHPALSLRDSYTFMALFFAGSREGARDVAIYQSFFVRDSALGGHSADFGGLEATADHQSSSAPKPPKNYESPTATPRILEKENQGDREKSCREQTDLESSFDKNAKLQNKDSSPNAPFSVIASRFSGVAIHKETTQILESSFEKNEQATQKVDSRENAPILNESAKDSSKSLSDFKIFDPNAASEKADSTFLPFALEILAALG